MSKGMPLTWYVRGAGDGSDTASMSLIEANNAGPE